MAFPLLATKLHIPRPRPGLVRRPRLIERLKEGMQCELTLLCAPAGFGKSTVLSEWIGGTEQPIAWLSLDQGDNDPARFLFYLAAALQTVGVSLGEGATAALQAPQPPPTEAILTALLNEIALCPVSFILVLDDYHVIDARSVDLALCFLLEHLPPQMHVAIATREDPHLPLARLRAGGRLTELRAADLRFTTTEAAEFLNRSMGLGLAATDVIALEERTEGWIAGLQLAALSMRGRDDLPGFIRGFAGDHRYVVDYLVEEVLRRQPDPVRGFLLQTSILERLNGPLCDAVTGQGDGVARLEALERGNFFVVPLDDNRHWYRYHHLFGDVLSAHLVAEMPERVPALHQRASAWHERHGSVVDAIHHARAAEDFARVADLVERALPDMRRRRQEATLLDWLKALPDEVLHGRPVLCVAYAHVVLASGGREGVEERLRTAERWLDPTAEVRARPDAPSMEAVFVDHEAFRRLPGEIAVARAGLALARGDGPAAVRHARRALDHAPEDDHLTRGGAAGFLGLAAWRSGDLEGAHRTYAAGMASLQKAGNLADAINGALALAAIRTTQGRLRQAMRTYEERLRLATDHGGPVLRGTADMYVGMSELLREQNDLQAATQLLLRSRELGEYAGFAQNRYRWRVAMARVREAQGDLHGALELLDEAERLYMSDFFPNVRPIAALRARVWLAQGRLGDALDWVREQGLSGEDDLGYLREFEHLTLARVLIAQHESDRSDHFVREASALLQRLLQAAEAGERAGSVIEILVVQARAHQARGDTPAALEVLGRALTLAEPEGYVRIFLDAGPPMAALLREVAKRRSAPPYVRLLRAAFGQAATREVAVGRTHETRPMIESLSERELQVLRLLRTELNGPEIARELAVSLNTMHTHAKNIYGKLGVNNRRAAIRRAEELNLL